jgi:spore germination cell wall hydrolase CwlJ-like protein
VVAITILAEARGEGNKGMYAVAAVIAQRAFERKRTPEQVCLKPYQFSCWNGKKLKDLEHLLTLPQGKYAMLLAKTVKRLSRDYVGYANHYHATWMKKKPYWAKGKRPVKIIGQHAFYKL